MHSKFTYTPGLFALFHGVLLLCSAFVFNGCVKDREPTAPSPLTRPEITANSLPSNAELNVPVTSGVQVYFTEKMDVTTLPNRYILQNFNGDVIPGTYSVRDTAAIFTPTQPLAQASIYKATIKGRVRDIFRNSISLDGYPVYNDTVVIFSNWFYTAGKYSENGFNRLYTADKSNIYVIGNLDSVVAAIPYSPAILSGFAVTKTGSYLLTSIEAKNRVDFISLNTNKVEKSITVSANPQSIVTGTDYAYVACVNGQAIEKINIASKSVEKTLALSFFPGKIALSSDGLTLFTLDQVTKDLVIIDAANGTIKNRVKNAYTLPATGELVCDDANRLLICDAKGGKLSVSTAGQSYTDLTTAYSFPAKVSPVNSVFDDSCIYVAAGSAIYKLNKQTFAFKNQLSLSLAVKSVSILPSKDLLIAITSASCMIIDLNSFTIVKEIQPGGSNLQFLISSPQKF